MSCIKTKTGENTIAFDAFYQYIWARNYGDTDVYISNHADIVAGDDDVALLPADEAVRLTVNGNTLYVLGSTTLEVHAQNFSDSPFAWNEAGEGGGFDITVVALSATENGTYTAPSGTAYSPVTVNVPIGAEIITRSDWNALTTAQKQAKGLVAIQDASTGYERGVLVNGADYIEANKYIPYSNNDSVLCEAYVDNFDDASDTWGVGTSPLHYVDNTHKPSLDTTENAVYIQTKTSGVVPYIDVGDSQKNYTIYFIAKIPSPTGQYERLVSCAYGYDSGNSSVICRSNNSDVLMFSTWGNDTNTSHDIKDYCVACLKLINDNGSKTTKMYLYDGTEITSLTKVLNNIARYICIGKFDISSSSSNQYPSDSYFKYFAAVDGAETDTVIENNIMNLYNEFLAE